MLTSRSRTSRRAKNWWWRKSSRPRSDANGGEPVFLTDGTPVGRVSSGAYGHTVGASIALCFVKTEHAVAGTELEIAILGQPHRAVILDKPPFDASRQRLRA